MTYTHSSGPLVSAAELGRHLGDPRWVIVDCRFNLGDPEAGRSAYAAGHIPGAYYADLDHDLAAPVVPGGAGGRHPLPAPDTLGYLARGWGVNADSRVVAYDDLGGAIAARLWWQLRCCGHQHPAVLDGGLDAWRAAGQSLDSGEPAPGDGAWEAGDGELRTATADDLAARLVANDCVLLDARAADRFAGRVEPLDIRAGHVPGASNAPFSANLEADKCFRAPDDLQAYYRAIIGADRAMADVVCMCGSGVTACHTLLALEIAGLPGAALYAGSWSDWISDERRPVASTDGDEQRTNA